MAQQKQVRGTCAIDPHRPVQPPEGSVNQVHDLPDPGVEPIETRLGGLLCFSALQDVEALRKSGVFPHFDSAATIQHCHTQYCGPTVESNWVLRGKLLVGACPASRDDTQHHDTITSILAQGIRTFVCLQSEYCRQAPEPLWRAGRAIRPYFQDVVNLLDRRAKVAGSSSNAAAGKACKEQQPSFIHLPIQDCGITDDVQVLGLALELVRRLGQGETLYVHCWGGHGRTGTVLSIMLHLMYPELSADEAMARCQLLHDLRRVLIAVQSPQTESQRDQVRRVVAAVQRMRDCLDAPDIPAPPPATMQSSHKCSVEAAPLTQPVPSGGAPAVQQTEPGGTKRPRQALATLYQAKGGHNKRPSLGGVFEVTKGDVCVRGGTNGAQTKEEGAGSERGHQADNMDMTDEKGSDLALAGAPPSNDNRTRPLIVQANPSPAY